MNVTPWWKQPINSPAWKGHNALEALEAEVKAQYGEAIPDELKPILAAIRARWNASTPIQQNTWYHPGWNTSGVGPGTPGYHGKGTIGSAAGAVGSGGVPTSQRGLVEKFGPSASGKPSWQVSKDLVNQKGLSWSERYNPMGVPPNRSILPPSPPKPVTTGGIEFSGLPTNKPIPASPINPMGTVTPPLSWQTPEAQDPLKKKQNAPPVLPPVVPNKPGTIAPPPLFGSFTTNPLAFPSIY